MRFIPKSLSAQDKGYLQHWPDVAQQIQAAYAIWCERMESVGSSPHVNLLKTRRENAQFILQTPVGEVIPQLTFVNDGPLIAGRVLLVRPEDVMGRPARAVFSVTITEDGFVYSGDDRVDPWPAMGQNYGWAHIERFLQLLMMAIVEDDVISTQYEAPAP